LRWSRVYGNLILSMPLRQLTLLLLLPFCCMSNVGMGLGQHSAPLRRQKPTGIAWRVQGSWRQDDQKDPLRSGDAILPGALLMPVDLKATHSITLLLPDGQRILYECFTEEDCARGFRIPALIETPSSFAASMIRAMSQALAGNRVLARTDPALDPTPAPATGQAHTTVARRDEAFAVLDRERQASVSGALSALPNGQYSYNLQPLDRRQPARFHVALQKTTAACIFPVPAAGLYELSIWDSQNTPRIDLFLAAVGPEQADAIATFPKAKKLVAEWDEDYYGWPTHDLLRAYLQALMKTAMKTTPAGPAVKTPMDLPSTPK
jgi:hypothetical protein